MNTIVPHLWFDKQAKEAAAFYTDLFPRSSVTSISTITGTPSGDCDIVGFTLMDMPFMAISAGPYFKINPSISFTVNFDPSQDRQARRRLDRIWERLSDGGKVLMPLDKYPFSRHYGWIQDRYGVSWQLILTNPAGERRPSIIPSLLFVGDVSGKAEEATDLYISIFKEGSGRGVVARYPAGMEPDREGTLMFTDFQLAGQWFSAMDSAHKHEFSFNEAVSFIVNCATQEEIDYYWDKLSAVPEAEQCGWLKDKYGVSWQITPVVMGKLMASGDQEQKDRVTRAFLGMKKFDIRALQAAFDGK